MSTQKQRVLALLERLPDDSSLQDIIYHIDLMDKIDVGIQRGEVEGYVDDEDLILESIDQAEWDIAWAAEAERRSADLKNGVTQAIPAATAFAAVRARVGK